MRRLLYVPVIHSEADLGRVGATLEQGATALSGKEQWSLHQETVGKFWNNMAVFLHSLDPHQLKVYQDGLAAEDELGRRIVAEAARRGSRNYQIVLELLHKGAELRKTEDPALLLQERENILGLLRKASTGEESALGGQEYRLVRDSLMKRRDEFIAETINTTLKEGEIGVLFMGAYHDVASYLMSDITVEAVKDPSWVRAYFEQLFQGPKNEGLEELAEYLTLPVSAV